MRDEAVAHWVWRPLAKQPAIRRNARPSLARRAGALKNFPRGLHPHHRASPRPGGGGATLKHRASDLVNQAYGLTPDEVALMWQIAPPRMPFTP